jgi:hypothetical protein
MALDALLLQGRAAAEVRLMVDACTITRIGERVTDTTTGEVTEPTTTLYTGKCRVQQAKADARTEDVGEDRLLMLRLEVQLPMSVTGLEVGDRITITASVHDPDLPGRVFRIHDLAHKTHATARRVQCLEITGL